MNSLKVFSYCTPAPSLQARYVVDHNNEENGTALDYENHVLADSHGKVFTMAEVFNSITGEVIVCYWS